MTTVYKKGSNYDWFKYLTCYCYLPLTPCLPYTTVVRYSFSLRWTESNLLPFWISRAKSNKAKLKTIIMKCKASWSKLKQ